MKDLFKSHVFRCVLAYAFIGVFGYTNIHSQPPIWLRSSPPPSSPAPLPSASAEAGANGGRARATAKVVERVRHDTITIVKKDTVVKIDTIYPPKPVYYNYTIYYEMVNKKLALQKSFLWDFVNTAQKTQLQSSDTTLLNLGNESLREASYTYDPNGNRTQTLEKIIEGLDMRVNGKNANITYRVGANLLLLDGKFDNNGLLMLSSDFSKRRYFLYFIPLDFLGIFEKYTLFLRVEKSEAM